MGGGSDLVALLRRATWRRWAAAATLGRLPGTMMVLAFVLVGEDVYGSVAVGAVLAGVATLAAGLAAPLAGRRLDQVGRRAGLLTGLGVCAAALAALAVAVAMSAPIAVVGGLGVVVGTAYAAVPGAYRALLVDAVDADHLPRANVVDAVVTEIGFVGGPALAGLAAWIAGPLVVVVTMAVVTVMALLLSLGLAAPPAAGRRSSSAAPAVAGTSVWRRGRGVYLLCLTVGVSLGLLESGLAARVVELGSEAAVAGPLLALTAVGSGAAGLVVSARPDPRGRPARRAVVGLGAFAVALGAASLAPSVGWLAVGAVAVGAPIAPLNAAAMQRLQDVLDPGRLAEGFALFSALVLIGVGIGDVLTGRLLAALGAASLLGLAGLVSAIGATAVLRFARGQRRETAAPSARVGR